MTSEEYNTPRQSESGMTYLSTNNFGFRDGELGTKSLKLIVEPEVVSARVIGGANVVLL